MRNDGRRRAGLFVMAGVALIGAAPDAAPRPALESIAGDDLLRHIRVLASDAFEGRAPGTPGEEKTIAYLTGQFRAMGLKPGNPDGTFVQDVPLVGFRTRAEGTLRVDGRTIGLRTPEDWVAVSRRPGPEVAVRDSEVVFVGYGVVAPEYGWDDYKGVDVRGKTLVMLVNDPPVPDALDPSRLDDALFKGRAMTYYGRWTYKFEVASARGAAAALLVHETGPAGYPYQVVVGSWGRENFDLPAPEGDRDRVAIEAWIARAPAERLCAAGGQDFEALKRAAVGRDFRPVPLGARADLAAENTTRAVRSRNVVALLEGSDPVLRDEHVIYSAHWDHLGRDERLDGDQIYNGAADNASGVAALLEIAQGFTRLEVPPRRSILFLAVTAEEKGLLGARYYARRPLYPLERTAADINMDVINLWGRTEDILSIGHGQTTLDDVLEAAAALQGRLVAPDAEPEKGLFYRSDHFEFAKQGVPALDAKMGMRFVGRPADYGRLKRDEYTTRDYHKVTDEVKPDWDLSGAVEDLQLLLAVGYRVAQEGRLPEWKPGSEFRRR
jgi:Zn-dependent M28 family amino/carboxypeptidase